MARIMQMMQTPLEEQWTSMFPNFTTLTGSRMFMKKLMTVSLSTITYLRGVFPDKAYGERNLSGLKLKILTEDSGIESVDKFINLIKGCYEAIDEKYICQLSVGICTDIENKDHVLEAYHLNFRYNDECSISKNSSNSITLSDKDPTVAATLSLLKNIFLTTDILNPLPPNAYLTMKLLYNDSITPTNYEPPGFEPCYNEKFSFPSNAVKLEIGKVATDLHSYKMYVKTALSKQPLKQLLEESVLTDSQRSRDNIDHYMEEEFMPPTQLESQPDIIENSVPVKVTPEKMECPCSCKQDLGTVILECSICRGRQHSICYGILQPEGNELEFYCIQCIHEAPTRTINQDLIYSYEGKEQQELCAVRRALVFCTSVKYVTVNQLEKHLKCSKELAKNLIERLEFEGFIRKSGQKYIVNENKIKNNGYREYFSEQLEKENVKISSQMKRSKAKQLYEKAEVENLGDTSRKPNSKGKECTVSSEEDFDMEKVPHSFENKAFRKSKRKPSMMLNDSFEDLPKRKRCINVRSPIILE